MASATPSQLSWYSCAYPRRDGQAELTWVAGYIPRQFTHPKAVTHPGTNLAQRRVTTLIETNTLPLSYTANLPTTACKLTTCRLENLPTTACRLTTCLENLEMSANLTAVREKLPKTVYCKLHICVHTGTQYQYQYGHYVTNTQHADCRELSENFRLEWSPWATCTLLLTNDVSDRHGGVTKSPIRQLGLF